MIFNEGPRHQSSPPPSLSHLSRRKTNRPLPMLSGDAARDLDTHHWVGSFLAETRNGSGCHGLAMRSGRHLAMRLSPLLGIPHGSLGRFARENGLLVVFEAVVQPSQPAGRLVTAFHTKLKIFKPLVRQIPRNATHAKNLRPGTFRNSGSTAWVVAGEGANSFGRGLLRGYRGCLSHAMAYHTGPEIIR